MPLHLFTMYAGTCDSTDDCVAVDPETQCVKTQQTSLCTCSQGLESCRVIGGCVDTPCKSAKRCLKDFAPFVSQAASLTSTDALADAFAAFCVSSGRQQAVCDSARLGISGSFKGNAGKRAGAICSLLSECDQKAVANCARYVLLLWRGRSNCARC